MSSRCPACTMGSELSFHRNPDPSLDGGKRRKSLITDRFTRVRVVLGQQPSRLALSPDFLPILGEVRVAHRAASNPHNADSWSVPIVGYHEDDAGVPARGEVKRKHRTKARVRIEPGTTDLRGMEALQYEGRRLGVVVPRRNGKVAA